MGGKRTVVEPDGELDAILRDGLIFPVFQPVVALADERAVGYEALARGPHGSRYHEPTALFAAAGAVGRVVELSWLCAVTALRIARAARLREVAVFINLDPQMLGTSCPAEFVAEYETAISELNVVFEITEHAVRRNPAEQLAAVAQARTVSARIAMDDVGSDNLSLAVMPIVRPDIIKIDKDVIQGHTSDWAVSRIVRAVRHEAEYTGAQVLAEGVETEEHLRMAQSVGATLVQGWRFGRPGPLPERITPSRIALARVNAPAPSGATPFAVVQNADGIRTATPQMLKSLLSQVEERALRTEDPSVFFTNLSCVGNLDDESLMRYREMIANGTEVVVLGRDVPNSWTTDVRYAPLTADDPLVHERSALLVSSQIAVGVFARQRTDVNVESFDTLVTYDRSLVIDAAVLLVARLHG